MLTITAFNWKNLIKSNAEIHWKSVESAHCYFMLANAYYC